jgi:hypothetical protein
MIHRLESRLKSQRCQWWNEYNNHHFYNALSPIFGLLLVFSPALIVPYKIDSSQTETGYGQDSLNSIFKYIEPMQSD